MWDNSRRIWGLGFRGLHLRSLMHLYLLGGIVWPKDYGGFGRSGVDLIENKNGFIRVS